MLSKRARAALLGYNPVNPRIISARFQGQPINMTVIQVYAPTAGSPNEDIQDFYGQLKETIKGIPRKDIKVIMGDWNAKVGTDRTGFEEVMGRYGYGTRNDRGELLLQFAGKHNMYITNTRFQQKDSRKWTWVSPDGRYRNMIDLMLIDKRWLTSIWNCRAYQGPDVDSDHSLVLSKIRLRFKCQRGREIKQNLNLESN